MKFNEDPDAGRQGDMKEDDLFRSKTPAWKTSGRLVAEDKNHGYRRMDCRQTTNGISRKRLQSC